MAPAESLGYTLTALKNVLVDVCELQRAIASDCYASTSKNLARGGRDVRASYRGVHVQETGQADLR